MRHFILQDSERDNWSVFTALKVSLVVAPKRFESVCVCVGGGGIRDWRPDIPLGPTQGPRLWKVAEKVRVLIAGLKSGGCMARADLSVPV